MNPEYCNNPDCIHWIEYKCKIKKFRMNKDYKCINYEVN